MEILNSKIFGEGNPQKLVIVHGLFGMLDNWVSLAKRFADFYEVHIVDQRNHGRSFHHPVHNYEVMAEDLKNYLDHHSISEAYLIGHSMGGKSVMQMACSHPEYIEKLVVVDIAPKYYAPHHQKILEGLTAVDNQQISSRKQADQVLSEYFDNSSIRMFLLKSLYRKEDGDYSFRFNLPVIKQQIEEVGKGFDLGCIFDQPTLFVDGEKSDYILESDIESIDNAFPDNEIIEIPDAGHWVHAEQPDLFWEKVMHFLQYS
jgi:pimeloyl-ACP methyl ester carboxylesterase